MGQIMYMFIVKVKVKFKLNINFKNKLLAWFCLRFDFDLSMSRWGEKIS